MKFLILIILSMEISTLIIQSGGTQEYLFFQEFLSPNLLRLLLKICDQIIGLTILLVTLLSVYFEERFRQNKYIKCFSAFILIARVVSQILLSDQNFVFHLYLNLQYQSIILAKINTLNPISHLASFYLLTMALQHNTSSTSIIAAVIIIISIIGFLFYNVKPIIIAAKKFFEAQSIKSQKSHKSQNSQRSSKIVINQAIRSNSFQSKLQIVEEQQQLENLKEVSEKSHQNNASGIKKQTLNNKYEQDHDIHAFESKREDFSHSLINSKVLAQQLELSSQTEDEIIIKQFNWIKNLSFVVVDQECCLIYKTFMINRYFKKENKNITEQEYFNYIMDVQVGDGNFDLFEAFQEDSKLGDQMNEDNSANQDETMRYSFKKPIQINEIVNLLLSDFERFKKCYFIASKLDTQIQELSYLVLKFFVAKIKTKIYLFIQFDSINKSSPAQHKHLQNQSHLIHSILQMISSNVSSFLNCIMTMSQISETDDQVDEVIYDKFLFPIRVSSIEITTYSFKINYISTLALSVSYLQFRIPYLYSLKITRPEIMRQKFFKTCQKEEKIQIQISIEYFIDFLQFLKFKQLLYIIIKSIVKNTVNSQIIITIQEIQAQTLQFQIKTSSISIDENEIKNLHVTLRKYSVNPVQSLLELSARGISKDHDLIVAQILSRKLSGSAKKGLENSKGNLFTFYLENFVNPPSEGQNQSDQRLNSKKETTLSFIIGSNSFHSKYYQDSTSRLYNEHSLHFSLSQISKQNSHKQSEHFSAFQKDSPPSNAFQNQKSQINSNSGKPQLSQNVVSSYNLSGKQLENDSQPSLSLGEEKGMQSSQSRKQVQFNYIQIDQLHNSKSSKQFRESSFKPSYLTEKHLDNLQENKEAFLKSWRDSHQLLPSAEASKSNIDFGSDFTPNIKIPYGGQKKLINQIIKHRINANCCSKVLISDNEYLNIQLLELILNGYGIKVDRAFSLDESMSQIQAKILYPCHCGNKSYILYFITLDLPATMAQSQTQGGFEFCRSIRDKMNDGSLDRGFLIVNSGMNEIVGKQYEDLKQTADHYISFPLDLFAITTIIKHFIL